MGLAHWWLVSPCQSFFLISPFLSLFFFQDDSLGHRGSLSSLFLPGLRRPDREGTLRLHQGEGALRPNPIWKGACGLCEQNKFCVRNFIGFLCKPRKIKPIFSPLLSISFTFSICQHRSPEGIPGSNWGWTPLSGTWNRVPKESLPYCTVFQMARAPLRMPQTPLHKIGKVKNSGK